jgi:1,4-alpha-glucan branching enzyme
LQLDKNRDLLFDFQEKYECNLIKKFSEYQQKGFIEILATCGTDVYLPHYMDMKEIVSAQIETGLQAYRRYFGAVPEGFWIPEM